jgi:mono/diheme cytochrome c family protein
MSKALNHAGPITLGILLGLGSAGCNTRARGTDEVASARADTSAAQPDTAAAPKTEASAATPPITRQPREVPRDTPPAGAAKPSGGEDGKGFKVSKLEYEGWRQYSVHCARCHGQDALPNPVAANLLISLGPGGPFNSEEAFAQIVIGGKPASGMPSFKGVLSPQQVKEIYAYVKGRAEKRIPPGRPASPA